VSRVLSNKLLFILPFLIIFFFSFSKSTIKNPKSQCASGGLNDSLILNEEIHLKNIQQLTFGGENAECYFSPDGTKFTFQTTRNGIKCDQIYTMNIDGSNQTLASTGTGRTTCAYYLPDNKTILYSSTHLASEDCPPRPDYSRGYACAVVSCEELNPPNHK